MSKFITIPGFSGGLAKGLYDPLTNQTYQSALDLDVYRDPKILIPVIPKLVNVTLPSDLPTGATSIDPKNYLQASDGVHYFLGSATISAQGRVIVWRASTLSTSPTWTADYNTGSSGNNVFAALTEFSQSSVPGLVFGDNAKLQHMNLSSKAVTTLGTLADTTERYGDVITHIGLGKVFFAHGSSGSPNKIGWYDGTTFTEGVLTVDAGYAVVNLNEYEKWVLAGIRSKSDSSQSLILIWDGNATTLEGIVKTGDMGLQGFKTKGNTVYSHHMILQNFNSKVANRFYKTPIGGKPSLEYEVFAGGSTLNANAVSLLNGHFYSAINGGESTNSAGIYLIHSSDNRIPEFPTKIRYPSAGTDHTFKSVRDNGRNFVALTTDTTSGTVQRIFSSGESVDLAAPSTGVYESNAFALNDGLAGKIKRIVINHKVLPTGCGFTVQIKYYGHYPWGTTVPVEDSYVDLLTPEGSGSSTGKTQSTTNTTITEIAGNELFKTARYAQIKIKFDEVLTSNSASIVFPILIELE